MARGQLSVRFRQVTDEFVAKDDARLGTAMLPSRDMEVAAADSRVGDINWHPAGPGVRNRYRPYGDTRAAFPDQRILLSHICVPSLLALSAKVRFST
jgi:hypothetical protein